jgi:hypothetical protein
MMNHSFPKTTPSAASCGDGRNGRLRTTLSALGYALLLLVLPACATTKAYRMTQKGSVSHHLANLKPFGEYQRTNNGKISKEVEGRATACLEEYPKSNFWLGHVEMKEYGTYQDNRQMSLIERAVEEDTRSGKGLFRKGITVVVFVHGWFNNAEEHNGNLNQFRDLLSSVAAEQKGQNRGVLGIYLSWRGLSVPPPLGFLSYWGRARTADNVGQGIMVEALARIRNIHWLVSAGLNGGGSTAAQPVYENSRLVLIGHSFGARALYAAVGGGMETNFLQPYWLARSFPGALGKSVKSEATMQLVPGFGDLVLLINPAMKSLPYRKVHYAMYSNGTVNYDTNQPVLMMVLSARNDVPNKSLLPIGETLGNRFRDLTPTNNRDQKEAAKQNIQSLGHYARFHTHDLSVKEDGSLKLARKQEFFAPVDHDHNGDTFHPALPVKTLRHDVPFYGAPKNADVGLLPFMMVSVDPKIINGHSDFWPREGHRHAYDFISSFISAQNKAVADARQKQAVPAAQRVMPQAY